MQGKSGTLFPGLYTLLSIPTIGTSLKREINKFSSKTKMTVVLQQDFLFCFMFPRCAPTANMCLPQTLEGNVVPPVYALNKHHQSSEKKQPDLPNLTEFVEIKR